MGMSPVHNHPGMHVFTRVLFGTMHVDEYAVEEKVSAGIFRVEKTTSTAVKGDVRVLTPERGNIHSFRALDWTAVFDVAVPPYAGTDRPCQYFAPVCQLGALLLKEASCPPGYITTEIEYSGAPML
jgi:plant cysteine oxidase